MLAWTTTWKDQHTKLPTKTLVNVTKSFCKGYGFGFEGIVLKSPHTDLIGKTVRVDGQDEPRLNQYCSFVNKKTKLKVVWI